ncbi:MAG: hypothetical protein NVSMB17_03370 [Candidatus Dormibacteria bacterium]
MKRRWPGIILPALLLTACGEAAGPASPAAPPSAAAAPTDSPVAGPPASTAPSATTDLAAFERIELTDVRTGEHFNLGGFQGKQVIIEGMATW